MHLAMSDTGYSSGVGSIRRKSDKTMHTSIVQWLDIIQIIICSIYRKQCFLDPV